jgi:chromosomal replication initiator protein
LHQSGNQIVLTSDRPPKDLQGMEERLISRFKWGLSADLQAPDYETMMAILEYKSSTTSITFSPEVKHYICDNIRNNIRELEGVIINLIAHASLTRKEIDLELAQKVIYNVVINTGSVITLDHIKKCVPIITKYRSKNSNPKPASAMLFLPANSPCTSLRISRIIH